MDESSVIFLNPIIARTTYQVSSISSCSKSIKRCVNDTCVVRTSKTRFVRSFSFLFFRSEECSRTNCVSSSSVAAEEHHHSNMTPIFLSFFASSCEPINKRFLPYVGQQRSRIICARTVRSFSHLVVV